MSRPVAGVVLIAAGVALHFIEPVSTLQCARTVAGPAPCTIRRTFFHFVPYQATRLPAVAALVAEPERLGRADPQAVTCTALSLMDGEGDATRFACVTDADAVSRAQRFFADGSADRDLRIGYSERLVVAVSSAFTLAGLIALLWAAADRRRGRRW